MKTLLVLALLFCPLSGLADDVPSSAPEEPGATIVTQKAHPDLLRLEQELSRKLDDKKDGRVTPEQYQAWKGEFRERLDAATTRVPSSPDNTAANARIMAQLGEGEAAQAALDQALEQNPKSSVLLTTKGQVLFDQKDFPGAAQNALQAWENSGRTDKGAWALYQMSKGRSAPSGTGSASPGLAPLAQGSPVVSADDSNKPIKLAVKGSALPSAVPAPGQDGEGPIKREGGLPLWPLAIPFAGGLIAYGLYRGTKKVDAQESEQPAAGALLTTPVLVAGSAEVGGGVASNVAKVAAVKTLGEFAITGVAAVGILVVGGTAIILTVNSGLNEMIAAQDKYNEAIDTHRDEQQSNRPSTKQQTTVPIRFTAGSAPISTAGNSEEDELKSADGRWKCAAQCNVQQIDVSVNCPERVRGISGGPNEELACRAAKRVATQSTPRGCYPRHCKCNCVR
ncbi:MAG: hypothetical protein Q8T11_09300 [Elusimicrobiota bacterium]|nr:hypothetical protein [Elusimicrobiota bacterium]